MWAPKYPFGPFGPRGRRRPRAGPGRAERRAAAVTARVPDLAEPVVERLQEGVRQRLALEPALDGAVDRTGRRGDAGDVDEPARFGRFDRIEPEAGHLARVQPACGQPDAIGAEAAVRDDVELALPARVELAARGRRPVHGRDRLPRRPRAADVQRRRVPGRPPLLRPDELRISRSSRTRSEPARRPSSEAFTYVQCRRSPRNTYCGRVFGRCATAYARICFTVPSTSV